MISVAGSVEPALVAPSISLAIPALVFFPPAPVPPALALIVSYYSSAVLPILSTLEKTQKLF